MRNKHFFLPLLLGCIVYFGSLTPAISQSAAEVHQQGIELLNAGQIDEAVEVLEGFVQNYPTAGQIFDAQLRLGYGYLFQGRFDDALELFGEVSRDPAPEEIQRIAANLTPQALSAKAAGMDEDDEERTQTFEQALEAFDRFLETYPDAVEVEQAVYGRAIVNYQLERYEAAAEDLRSNLERFPNSPTVDDSRFLLAITMATRAAELLRTDEFNEEVRQQAAVMFGQAEDLLNTIVEEERDVALANDARFQLGELYLRMGRFTEDREEASQLFDRSMAEFRSVAPNEDMVEAQEARILAIRDRLREALRAGDGRQIQRLNTLRDRELTKLAELQEREEQTIAAKLQMADVFMAMNRYDEGRTMLRYLDPFLETEDQQKTALYLLTFSFAAQNARDQALVAYEAFKANHAGDPMGENLPILIGNIFLNEEFYDPARAAEFFEEARETYPDGVLTALATLQGGQARMAMGDYETALTIFQEYMAGETEPDLAATAELGIADIQAILGDLPSALEGYRNIRETYPGREEAVEADYRVGVTLLSMGRPSDAESELVAFLESHPEAPQVPAARFTLGEARAGLGNEEAAEVDFLAVIEEFPESEAAPFAYFQLSYIYQGQGRTEEMVELMEQFMDRYPRDRLIFFAYQLQAGPLLAEENYQGAAELYWDFVQRFPERRDQVAEALESIATWTKNQAQQMGRYVTLTEEQRIEWQELLEQSQEAVEQMIEFDDTGELASSGLGILMDVQRLYMNANMRTPAEVEEYLENLADQYEGDPARQNKILFTLAAFLYDRDRDRALATMRDAYDPDLVFAPDEVNLFAEALLDEGDYEFAEEVYTKLRDDYPNPEGVDPTQAPYDVQIAQSTYLYGMGRIAAEQGDTERMQQYFTQLQEIYPWSPKILEANLGIAEAMIEAGEFEEAMAMLPPIIRAQTATAEVRARAMYVLAAGHEEQGNLEPAIDNFIKIASFYPGVENFAAAGLWRGGQLLERQAGQATEAADRNRAITNARRAYQNLVERYPASGHADDARDRLQSLPSAG